MNGAGHGGYTRDGGSVLRLVALVAACAFCMMQPVAAEAGSVAGSAVKAAAKRLAGSVGAVAAPRRLAVERLAAKSARPIGKPTDVVIRRSRHPQAAANIEHAQRMGQPTVLTLDRANAVRHRTESLRHIKRKNSSLAGMDRDEYPPAMTREGGANSNVRYINAGDNRGAGKSMERQVRSLPDGARIRVVVGD